MNCLQAFSSFRLTQPCSRSLARIRAPQSFRALVHAHGPQSIIQVKSTKCSSNQSVSRRCTGPWWVDSQSCVRGGSKWRTVRSFAGLQEAEKPQNSDSEFFRGDTDVKKETGLAEKKGEKKSSNSPEKPEICTADELHYVPVPGTAWRLALWRYLPSKNATKRNHPVLMLSGIATNAFCFDLAPKVSLAQYLADAGFDTWILEVRGAGLSKREGEPSAVELGVSGEGLSESIQESVVGAAIEGATRATPHMEKQIEEKHVEASEGPVTARSNGPSVGSSGSDNWNGSSDSSSVNRERPPDNRRISSKDERVEKATGVLEDSIRKESKKNDPKNSWVMSAVSRIAERYERLVRVNKPYLFPNKIFTKITSLFEQNYLYTRIWKFNQSLTSLLDGKKTSAALEKQLSNATKSIEGLVERSQRSFSPTFSSLQGRLNTTVGSVHEVIELVAKYDWDFDNYLEEDVPVAMDYVKSLSNCPDGKLIGLGHSMGGIILYAMLGTRADHGLKAAVTVASSLEYGNSDSSLKLLLPLASPAQLLNIPVVPLGLMMSAVVSLITKPPYPLAWIGYHVSAKGMMDMELFQKLVLTNFCTIPMGLLHQLRSAFEPGGLKNRDGSVFYKDLLKDCEVPVMAIAGDRDLICPTSAVIDTAKVFPKEVVYKEFGSGDRHYSHYDLLCGRTAKEEVYPEVLEFLVKNDD